MFKQQYGLAHTHDTKDSCDLMSITIISGSEVR
jgi:hypothetical protein